MIKESTECVICLVRRSCQSGSSAMNRDEERTMPKAGASSIIMPVWYFPLIDLCANIRAAVTMDCDMPSPICRQRSGQG